jgi:hypothetical protein
MTRTEKSRYSEMYGAERDRLDNFFLPWELAWRAEQRRKKRALLHAAILGLLLAGLLFALLARELGAF